MRPSLLSCIRESEGPEKSYFLLRQDHTLFRKNLLVPESTTHQNQQRSKKKRKRKKKKSRIICPFQLVSEFKVLGYLNKGVVRKFENWWYTLMFQPPALMLKFPKSALLRTLMLQDAQWKRALWSNQFGKHCPVNSLQWSPKTGLLVAWEAPSKGACVTFSKQHCSNVLNHRTLLQITPVTSHQTTV